MRSSLTALLAAGFPIAVLSQAPVFTYGPSSNYQKAPAVTATPASTNLLITPTDVSTGPPAEGIDFFLGSDMQASIKETLDGVCADGKLSQKCVDSLSAALNHREQYTIESRIVGIDDLAGLALASFVLVVAAGIQLYRGDQAEPVISHFHFESTDVAQLRSMTESTAVLATSTGASDLITVTVSPTPTSTSFGAASMTTLSADASGHSSGDVLITLPTQPAELLNEILRRAGAPGNCKSTSESQGTTKRQTSGNGPNFNSINNIAVFALPMAAPGQLLEGLGMQALDHVPQLKNTLDQASLQIVQQAAAAMEQFADVAVDLTNRIAAAVWTATYNICVLEQIELSTLVLEDPMVTDDPAEDEDENPGCSTDIAEKPACDDPQCAGESGKCSQGDDEGCTCLRSMPFFTHPGDKNFVETAYKVLTAMTDPDASDPASSDDGSGGPRVEVPLDGGTLMCDTRTDPGNTKYFSSLEDMVDAASRHCQALVDAEIVWEPAAEGEPRYPYNPNNARDDNGVRLGAAYSGDTGCPAFDFTSDGALDICKKRFGAIIHNCDTSNPDGVERWKQGGLYQKDCVMWSMSGGDDSIPQKRR